MLALDVPLTLLSVSTSGTDERDDPVVAPVPEPVDPLVPVLPEFATSLEALEPLEPFDAAVCGARLLNGLRAVWPSNVFSGAVAGAADALALADALGAGRATLPLLAGSSEPLSRKK